MRNSPNAGHKCFTHRSEYSFTPCSKALQGQATGVSIRPGAASKARPGGLRECHSTPSERQKRPIYAGKRITVNGDSRKPKTARKGGAWTP